MKFSLFRLFVAVVPAAVSLTFVRWLGFSVSVGLCYALIIGMPLSLVALIATKKDAQDLLKLILAIAFAVLVLSMLGFVVADQRMGN